VNGLNELETAVLLLGTANASLGRGSGRPRRLLQAGTVEGVSPRCLVYAQPVGQSKWFISRQRTRMLAADPPLPRRR
jgi:hypothetical protein